jgi:monothiol glutaredoxin
MPRPLLAEAQTHPAIRDKLATYQLAIVREVQAAVAANPVLVVGMAVNPFCKRARKSLDAAGVAHRYLEYGSYISQWHPRLALKMWTGWPTFPMVFVRGTLIGGASDVKALIESGELKRLVGA